MSLVLVVHAGAGGCAELREHEADARGWLLQAIDTARVQLEAGGSSVDAAVAAVQIMESCEVFNAGYGSALCSDGSVQMSAALMRGADRAAGAVAGIRVTKHPILAAQAVMGTDEVLMIGAAADERAIAAGADRRDNEAFVTERQKARLAGEQRAPGAGTVGAVALDVHGVLAAATSTGGRTGQPPGRVGDSPVIGAGTWADSRVAISCTGDGEAFIRCGAARLAACLVESGQALTDAADHALKEVGALGGTGGLIALDARGNAVMPFTTPAMPRGVWRTGEDARVWLAETS